MWTWNFVDAAGNKLIELQATAETSGYRTTPQLVKDDVARPPRNPVG